MPSRKQRRRRAKERRHDYEYVYIDDDGNEVEIGAAEARPAPPAKAKANGAHARPSRQRGSSQRGVRAVEPPSWRRVRRRALIIGPLMFLFINFLSKNLTLGARIAQTVVMLALFLPFSYLMDRTLYRAYLKRTGATAPAKKR